MTPAELAIFCDDVEATAAFYERLLGKPPTHAGEGIAIFHVGGFQILIHETYEPAPDDLPCENHFAFAVPDVDAACSELQSRGLAVEYPPKDYDWGRSAYLRDPAGRLIELQQSTDSAPD